MTVTGIFGDPTCACWEGLSIELDYTTVSDPNFVEAGALVEDSYPGWISQPITSCIDELITPVRFKLYCEKTGDVGSGNWRLSGIGFHIEEGLWRVYMNDGDQGIPVQDFSCDVPIIEFADIFLGDFCSATLGTIME